MRLYARCTNCRSDIYLNKVAEDRFKLAKRVGEKVELECESCGKRQTTKMNDIKAEENKVISLIASVIFLLGTVILLVIIWPYLYKVVGVYAISGLLGVVVIPFMVYQAINAYQSHRIQYFNSKYYG